MAFLDLERFFDRDVYLSDRWYDKINPEQTNHSTDKESTNDYFCSTEEVSTNTLAD